MGKESSKKVVPKKRGRPATGKEPMLAFRAPPEFTAEVEAWAKRQPDNPSRSEALRRLVEIARGLATNQDYGMKHSTDYTKVNKAIKPLTSAQMRAARGLIRWSAEDLARQTALSVTTIRRAELTEEETSMTAANDLAVRRALEAAGVIFIDENDEGPGVRLRKRSKEKSRK
jgi:hypothetical protein